MFKKGDIIIGTYYPKTSSNTLDCYLLSEDWNEQSKHPIKYRAVFSVSLHHRTKRPKSVQIWGLNGSMTTSNSGFHIANKFIQTECLKNFETLIDSPIGLS